MKSKKPSKSIYTILILLILSLFLSACAGSASTVASGWAGITSDQDTAYLAFSTQIVAVNLTNGTERWRFPAEANAKITFYADPVLTESGQLLAGSYDSILYSINPANGLGTPFFSGAENRYIGSPLVTADMIYAPSADHKLYAIGMDGQLIWYFETSEPLWAQPAIDPSCDCIYLPSMDHRVYALDAKTGVLLWNTEDLGGAIVSPPSVSGDMIYVGTFAKDMIALDAITGKELWRFNANDWVWAEPALDGDTLYFGDLSGTFYAVDRLTGASKWQIQPGGAIVGTPLITPEGIYFTTESGSLVAVNSEGTIRWNQPYETSLHAGPVSAGNSILIATSNPESLLIAVDPSGVQKWTFALEKK
jgi:outer membrane protein assembly factor BamB